MPRMKSLILLIPFAVAPALLLQADLGVFESIVQAFSQVPLVGAMAWILLRQQDKHQQTLESLTNHWLSRAKERDQFYQALLADMLKTIEELAKK